MKTVLRAVRQCDQKSCGPGRPETRQMRRLVVRVSQMLLAKTHKLLTVPCISDTSCQQLVRRRLLLHGLQRPSMNRPLWCRLTSQASGLPPRQGMRVQPSGRFPSCKPDQLADSLPECPLIIIIIKALCYICCHD